MLLLQKENQIVCNFSSSATGRLGQVHRSCKYRYRLTRLVRLIPAKRTDSAGIIATRFINNWITHGFGVPASIVSDRDSKFESDLWEALAKRLHITLRLSTSRHQQTDGQSEIAIRTYKRTAKKYASLMNTDWDEKLGMLEFALNNSISSSTGFTPFFLAFGFNPKVFPEDYDYLSSNDLQSETTSNNLFHILEDSLAKATASIHSSQALQAKYYNHHRIQPHAYSIGDKVLLHSAGINWPSFSE